MDSITSFKGYGKLQLGVRGQRVGLNIETVWKGDTNFTINLYTIFGTTIATISTDSAGKLSVRAGGMLNEKKSPDDTIDIGSKLIDYPFTYRDFMHILTGRLLKSEFIHRPSDSLSLQETNAYLYWNPDICHGNNFSITMEINRKQSRIKKVSYSSPGSKGWKLVYASFGNNVPEEIQFKDANNNYFNLTYEDVSCRCGAAECR